MTAIMAGGHCSVMWRETHMPISLRNTHTHTHRGHWQTHHLCTNTWTAQTLVQKLSLCYLHIKKSKRQQTAVKGGFGSSLPQKLFGFYNFYWYEDIVHIDQFAHRKSIKITEVHKNHFTKKFWIYLKLIKTENWIYVPNLSKRAAP